MKFSPTAEPEDSIYQYTLFLLGLSESDTTTYPVDGSFTRSANYWYRKADSWIWQATGTWEFDDSNFTDLPIATTTLVDGQKDYVIPSTARKLDRVEVLSSGGDYYTVIPFDKSEIKGAAMTEFYETNGFPKFYDMVGRSIFLYPAPAAGDVTTAAGLKLYYSRDIAGFIPTDTEKEPGFDNHFHPILALGAALDFAIANGIDHKKAEIIRELETLKAELQEFYGARHRDMKPRFIPKVRDQI